MLFATNPNSPHYLPLDVVKLKMLERITSCATNKNVNALRGTGITDAWLGTQAFLKAYGSTEDLMPEQVRNMVIGILEQSSQWAKSQYPVAMQLTSIGDANEMLLEMFPWEVEDTYKDPEPQE